MKELIGKLSRGQIEYDLPETEISVTSIEKSVEQGTVFRGSFEVFNKTEGEIKGIVYSTNEYLRIINSQFIGKNNKIEYELDTRVLEQSDVISGRINIVSNGGEIFIPFNFDIKAEGMLSSIGTISNMFHFLNLVKQEYDEALKLFFTSDFERIILKDNIAGRCMYRGLIKGSSRKRALEEFIVAINKKQKVEFDISDTVREYDSLDESYGDILKLTRSTWGMLEIEVRAEGDFIAEYRAVITDEDFAGNHYEFSYLIDVTKLHAGMNYGKIIFKSMYETHECIITVDNVKEHDLSLHEVDKCIIGINKLYLDFRMRKCSIDKWADESLALIDRARGFNDDNPLLRLFQAQVYISKKNDNEAKWLIESVTDEVMAKRDEDIALYSYYLYIKALQKRELEYTLMITESIRKYYENGYDRWELLWILLYIDPAYENNKSLKLARIKEQYKLGCHSTLMYYEALYVLNKQPMLLRMINSFELQVFNFGSKYNAIDLRLAVQISELALHEKNFRPVMFHILVRLYEKFENKVILNAILSVLIRGNITSDQYFKWYELGVKANMQVTRLYEYFVMAMPKDYNGDIPNTVLMYYVYNPSLLGEREAFFYSIIIKNKNVHPNVYKNYLANIEHFALEMLRQGRMDVYMSIIYSDILTPAMITQENEKALPKVLNTWEITVSNDKIKEAIIIHKEIAGEDIYGISQGKAYVNIYTDDAIILFRDFKGNRYLNTIEYGLLKVMNKRELSEAAIQGNQDNVFVMAKECEQSLKYHKYLNNGVTMFSNIMSDDRFKREYKDFILQDIIEYFLDNYDGEELDEYLREIEVNKLSRKSRLPIIELMIMRGLYKEALDVLARYGTFGIDERKLLKLCTYVIRENFEADSDRILRYCDIAFKRGKYDEDSLKYLGEFYNGTTKEMLELWRVSREFAIENRDLEERLIAQMLFSRTSISSIFVVYDSYYKKGAIKLIKNAYLFYESYVYFVMQNPVDEMFFRHLEDELALNEIVPDVCNCAFLYHNADKVSISDNTKELCRDSIEYLEKKGIVFDYFKKFNKWFSISGNILDKTTVEYRTEPKDKIFINYFIDTGCVETDDTKTDEYMSEEMKQVFSGMYVKAFTLFYGEKIDYYITEISNEDVVLTESSKHLLDDRSIETNTSRYGRLNDILVCRDLREETIVSSLAEDYYVDNEMVRRLFS